jgi:hypothetical protein
MALDPYAILEVDRTASPGELRRAYRRQAKRLHPDANNSNEATGEFQQLQDAYRVLQNPRLRLAYDASKIAVPQTKITFPEFGSRPNLRPFKCQRCDQPTAQPRYAIYWTVISNLVYAIRRADMGLFCVGCARKASLRATIVTAVLGWWSLPGLVHSARAIFRNAAGGERLRGGDSMLLWNSAILFYNKGDGRMAKGLAKQVVARGDANAVFAGNMVRCLNYLQPNERGVLKDAWRAQKGDRWKHALIGAAVPYTLGFGGIRLFRL